MGAKDIAEKNLEAWNDVFADIVNVLLFNGKRIILENELEADTTNSMFKADANCMNRNAMSQSSGGTEKFAFQSWELKIKLHKIPTCRFV